ncbi:MAG: hypothetical protein JW748_03325, partial [Anaerolineales bacterium]|nr:hypothetical protein [Anaerolineales bacterium]
MAADAAKMEEFAIALPFSLLEPDLMVVIIASECEGELIKMEPVGFLRVTLGLLDFSDHSVVHRRLLGKKKARGRRAPCHFGFTLIVDPLRSWRFSSDSEGKDSIEEYRPEVNS